MKIKEVNPVSNSSGALNPAGITIKPNPAVEQRGIISNGVKAKAKALGLKNTFGLSKVELIRGVQRAQRNFDCFGTAKEHCGQFQCCYREDCLRPSGAGRD